MWKFGQEVKDQDLEQLGGLFQLLSDKTRLRILLLLAEGERNVTSLCESLGMPQPTVSHHLGLLRIRNIISHRRQGKRAFYALNGVISAGGQALELDVENLAVKIYAKAE
jgi:DNA-binding transcriptional ArsR family regulator